jgi:hypothetical protein
MNVSHLARAIATGSEESLFALPKGPAGKVKLYKPPRVLSTTTKAVGSIILSDYGVADRG